MAKNIFVTQQQLDSKPDFNKGTIQFLNGWSTDGFTAIRKIGDFVYLSGAAAGSNFSDGTSIIKVPSQFEIAASSNYRVQSNSQLGVTFLRVETDGTISITGNGAQYIKFEIGWITN